MKRSYTKRDRDLEAVLRDNAVSETRELAIYVAGMARGSEDQHLERAAYWLERLSGDICGRGYIGCRGGEQCSSDHK